MPDSSKALYRTLCSKEKTIPLFLTDWWLDATSGENWDVALAESNGEIVGALPYSYKKQLGFKLMQMPGLTGFLGPWIKPLENQKYATRLSSEMEILGTLVSNLPSFHLFKQNFSTSVTNWLPFYWKKFRQTTRYTYLLDLDNTEVVFNEFKSSVRGKIRKAAGLVAVQSELQIDDFYKIWLLTFQRQKMTAPVSLDFLTKTDRALASKGQRKIFYAIDKEGKIHSALYLVWDRSTAYVLMVGEDPELRNSGAGILLVWEAIQFAKNQLGIQSFDFLGSMIESVETVRRSFGARQVPYFQVRKIDSILLKTAFFIKEELMS